MLLLAVLLISGCSLPDRRAAPTPVRFGSATRRAPSPTPSPPPTLTPIPTDPVWPGWTSPLTNVALKKHVKVSRETYGFGGPAAVDGSLRTRWNSGAAPTQWIEIDLGQAYDIAEIRLLPGQTNPGVTVHNVLGKGPLGGRFELLYTFESQVSDSPLLAKPPGRAWQNIRFVRIETTFSPVPVGWKEIQVLEAE